MKSIFRNILILLLMLTLLNLQPASAASVPAAVIDFTDLDQVITAQMEKHGLPGVSLAVIENNEIIYLKGYGSAGNGREMTTQTRMFIGSQSKSVTALAIAQLAEQGKLDLDAPVQTYIPWFRVADEDASAKITLNHLLHHTSGLSDAGYGVLLPLDASLEDAVRSLEKAQITAPPGTQHQYFNVGYAVLSYIIEITSGQSYAAYVQENIFKPLGMNSTSADPAAYQDLCQGYSRLFGFAIPMQQSVPLYAVGEGYIVSTAEDMARYAIAFMDGGQGLVSPKTIKRILTPGVGTYGLGWYISDGGLKISHGGANETFRTEVNLYPTRSRAFVLLTNEGYQMDHFISAGQLTSSVEAVVLGRTPPAASDGVSVRWIGWGIGILVLGLLVLHFFNFRALRTWSKRTRNMSFARRALDVAISFIIPSVILFIIYTQVKAFYGNRFNLLTNLAYLSVGLPDIFILMLVGTIPDYTQFVIKIILWIRGRKQDNIPA